MFCLFKPLYFSIVFLFLTQTLKINWSMFSLSCSLFQSLLNRYYKVPQKQINKISSYFSVRKNLGSKIIFSMCSVAKIYFKIFYNKKFLAILIISVFIENSFILFKILRKVPPKLVFIIKSKHCKSYSLLIFEHRDVVFSFVHH